MKRFVVLFCIFLFCDCKEDEREPKFFFGPKIQTVYAYRRVPEYVTEFVPSSCIVVEPTLPACRHVRNLEIYPSAPTRIARTQTPQIQNAQPVQNGSVPNHHLPTPPLRGRPQQVKYTSPYWNWNPFNAFRVQNYTYTATKTEYVTMKVEDPNTVVSFFIKGCRPSKLPFNLPECAQPEKQPEKNIIVMAPLKFVPSVDAVITPTKSDAKSEAEAPEEVKEEEAVQKEEEKNRKTESN